LNQHIDYIRQKVSIVTEQKRDHIALSNNALLYLGSNKVYGTCPLPEKEMSDLLIEKREDDNDRTEDDLTIPKLQDTVYLTIGSTLRKKKSQIRICCKKPAYKICNY
jgi:hypothetical protein